jgi:hypothetical protein
MASVRFIPVRNHTARYAAREESRSAVASRFLYGRWDGITLLKSEAPPE